MVKYRKLFGVVKVTAPSPDSFSFEEGNNNYYYNYKMNVYTALKSKCH